MRDLLTTIAELVGALLVALGAGMVYVPAGVIVLGLEVVGFAYMAAGDDEPSPNP